MTEEIKRMNITIDEDTRAKLETLSEQMKQSMSGVLRLLVIQEFERKTSPPQAEKFLQSR